MWRIPRRCGLYGERHLSSSCGSRDSSVLSGRACPGASQARKTNLARGLGGCSVAAGRRDACRHHRLGATARGDAPWRRELRALMRAPSRLHTTAAHLQLGPSVIPPAWALSATARPVPPAPQLRVSPHPAPRTQSCPFPTRPCRR